MAKLALKEHFGWRHQRMRNEQEDIPERASRLEGWSFLEQQSCDSHAYFTDMHNY